MLCPKLLQWLIQKLQTTRNFCEKNKCHDLLPVVISPVAAASQDLVEAGDKAEVIIIKLRNFDKLTLETLIN